VFMIAALSRKTYAKYLTVLLRIRFIYIYIHTHTEAEQEEKSKGG
jgi:hypothetical protein